MASNRHRVGLKAEPSQGNILVISHDIVGAQMAGPGIRYYHLARVLAREFPTILAMPAGSNLPARTDFSSLIYQSGRDVELENAIQNARAVLVPALWLAQAPMLLESQVPLVVDGYDPYVAETLFLHPDAVPHQQIALTQAYLAGDFFLCASERQRDWWLGLLEANGRVNPYTYAEDHSLRRLVDVVPFGLPETLPRHTRNIVRGVWAGIGETDRVILWGGGLWLWLDPLIAIRAVAQVWQQRQDVRLIFPGTRHPNPGMAEIPTHLQSARDLAAELGLLDKAIFFGDWISYDNWQNVLLESDLALTLHGAETLESRLAFRSRVLDYIWAGLPIVAPRGDTTSKLIAEYELGALVEPNDEGAVAAALLRLLDAPREAWHDRFERARRALTWEQAARPLIEFCRNPRRAPDKVARGEQVGPPYYLAQIQAAQIETAQTRIELERYKNRRVVRWANQLARLRVREVNMVWRSLKCRQDHQSTPKECPPFTDVTDYFTDLDLAALQVIHSTSAWLTRADRLFLFAFTVGLRPARYLEIGTLQGGSALLVAAAMDASGVSGRIVCVEPNPQIPPETWKRIEHRTTLVQGYSPDALAQAYRMAGSSFDLVFIDGDHTAAGVLRDAQGVLPFVSRGGYLLFHDAFNADVQGALDQFAEQNAHVITDCGYVTREATHSDSTPPVFWGGLRLMHKQMQ